MRLSEPFQRQPKDLIFAEALLATLVIGLLDFLSGSEVSMFVFYGVPILAAAWFCDKKRALLLAIICALVWWWADILAGHQYTYTWVQVWESVSRFGYFAAVAIAASGLKTRHDEVRSRLILLEHSQRLEREIIEISEREQRRIGRDLHDGLCQYFAAIGCGVASLRADLLQRNLPNEAAVAQELAELLNNGVVQARNLARGLVPVHMNEAGLSAALAELAHSVSHLQNIECIFDSDDEVEMNTPSAATHLYRIAQEAINNASRHGRASIIRVGLFAEGDSGTLHVADNGRGISQTVSDSAGLGLNIMSYRARLVGGQLAINEPPEGGTLIICTFPQQSGSPEQHVQAA
jgi:signal transduction histidine kinase